MKKLKRVLLVGIMATAIFILAGCGKTTIKLNKYVTITAEGYDSMGTASYEFDYDTFKKDYSGKIKVSKNNSELRGLGLLAGMTTEELLLDTCVRWKLDKTSGLKNGDIVTLKWDCEDAMAEEYFNVKLDYSDITYTVKGLEEVGKFDPFDYVKVSFSGTSPNGFVVITPDYDKAEMQYVAFKEDKTIGLKNGDTVTVNASISGSVDSFVEKFGVILEETEKIYTVDGLAEYISDISDIPNDMYDKMDRQLQDVLTADFASWDNETLKEMKLLGNYILTLKDGMSGSPNNYVYFVYRVTAENDKSNGDFNYYWYGYYEDVMILADGTCTVDLGSYTVPSKGWFVSEIVKFDDQKGYQYYGFKDLDSLFNNHVVSKIEKYEYKQTIQE